MGNVLDSYAFFRVCSFLFVIACHVNLTQTFLNYSTCLSRPESLDNVETLWAPEIKRHCRDVPVVLVGNKTDLREGQNPAEDLVTSAAGTRMSQKIRATDFLECSAKTKQGVTAVFQAAAMAAMIRRHENLFLRNFKKSCVLI